MKRTIKDVICALSNANHIHFKGGHDHRYRVDTVADGTEISYYFSCPIYRRDNGQPVTLRFDSDGKFNGSRAVCEFDGERATVKVGECYAALHFPDKYKLKNKYGELVGAGINVYPTYNGMAFRIVSEGGKPIKFKITFDFEGKVKKNSRIFAVMKNRFDPHITVGVLYAHKRDTGEYFALNMQHEQTGDGYILTIAPEREVNGSYEIFFEIDAYEYKLVNDTVTESRAETLRNTYAPAVFLSKGDAFGEQWLYSRIDKFLLGKIDKRRIVKAELCIPFFNGPEGNAYASDIVSRFCSFASNWKNKILPMAPFSVAERRGNHLVFDLTEMLRGEKSDGMSRGMVIRQSTEDKCTILASGDCSYIPEVIKITYERRDCDET